MRDQRYPITEIGILNMVRRLIAIAERDIEHEDCEARYFPAAKIDGPPVPAARSSIRRRGLISAFISRRIFVDDQLKIPVVMRPMPGLRSPAGSPNCWRNTAIAA